MKDYVVSERNPKTGNTTRTIFPELEQAEEYFLSLMPNGYLILVCETDNYPYVMMESNLHRRYEQAYCNGYSAEQAELFATQGYTVPFILS